MVPCTILQRDGRMYGPVVAAGKVEAAEAEPAELFVVVMKTEGEEGGEKAFSLMEFFSLVVCVNSRISVFSFFHCDTVRQTQLTCLSYLGSVAVTSAEIRDIVGYKK